MTTISQAIVLGKIDLAKKLIEDNIGINQTDIYGGNPLIQACILESVELVTMLISYGADVNRQSITGQTALHWAVDTANIKIIRLLLKNGADANAYGTTGQPPLVSATLSNQDEIIELLLNANANAEFADDFIKAKRIGHRFDLKGYAKVLNNDNQYVEVNYEGFILEFSLNLIRNSLYNFLDSDILTNNFSELKDYLVLILQALDNAKKMIPPIFRDKFQAHREQAFPLLSNDLIIIPIAYQGHAITFIKYYDYFARCDRGVNKLADTSVVYRINNPFAFNEKFIEHLLYENHTEQYIHKDINTILSLSPVTSIPTKQQVSGNCSWANTEASVVTTLFMIIYVRKIEMQQVDLERTTLRYSMKLFDAWTNWDKQVSLTNSIEHFNVTTVLARKASFANMLAAVLFQSLYYRDSNHIALAKSILKILSKNEFKPILRSYVRAYCRPQGGKKGIQFTKMLLTCDLDIFNLELMTAPRNKSEAKQQIVQKVIKCAAIGNIDLIKLLFKENSWLNVDEIDASGSTALMYGAWLGHLDIVKYLVEKLNADVELVNDKGGSAKQYALLSENAKIQEYLLKIKLH